MNNRLSITTLILLVFGVSSLSAASFFYFTFFDAEYVEIGTGTAMVHCDRCSTSGSWSAGEYSGWFGGDGSGNDDSCYYYQQPWYEESNSFSGTWSGYLDCDLGTGSGTWILTYPSSIIALGTWVATTTEPLE